MSFIKIWIHSVWSTKNWKPLLSTKEIRFEVFEHIYKNAKEKGIYMDFVNGCDDHVHCLLSLGVEQNIGDVMQLIKGESSFWINHQDFMQQRFTWQKEYYAVSVSPSHVEMVRNYIRNQEKHHQKISFQEEVDELIEKWGFEKLI